MKLKQYYFLFITKNTSPFGVVQKLLCLCIFRSFPLSILNKSQIKMTTFINQPTDWIEMENSIFYKLPSPWCRWFLLSAQSRTGGRRWSQRPAPGQ